MNMEIKNFYPFEESEEKLRGSLHIALKFADIEVNIRGVYVCKEKDRWIFRMPFGRGKCPETGEPVSFPTLTFSNPQLNRDIISKLREQAPIFIKGKENLIKWPAVENNDADKIKPLQDGKISTASREMALIEKLNPKHNLPNKTWIDVPPRKTAIRKKQVSGG